MENKNQSSHLGPSVRRISQVAKMDAGQQQAARRRTAAAAEARSKQLISNSLVILIAAVAAAAAAAVASFPAQAEAQGHAPPPSGRRNQNEFADQMELSHFSPFDSLDHRQLRRQLHAELADDSEPAADEFGGGRAEVLQQQQPQLAQIYADALAISAPSLLADGLPTAQCQRIGFLFCVSMPYNLTRMPNFFGDQNQLEASERAKHLELLAQTNCSRHLLAYLCELLAPMCLESDTMRKFEIFPCRSYCRQLRADCEPELKLLFSAAATATPTRSLHSAFQCEQLPYESNGGSAGAPGPSGPCHEMPPVELADHQLQHQRHQQQQQQQQRHQQPQSQPTQSNTNFWHPYNSLIDSQNQNVPPFITDTSNIDLNQISLGPKEPPPVSRTHQHATGQPQANWSLVQSIGLSLARPFYSNLLLVLTIVCSLALILLLMNFRRLCSVRALLRRKLSSSSSVATGASSSSSSDCSRRKLAASLVGSQFDGSMGTTKQQLAKVSPSSSSRSLMLVSTSGGGGQPMSKMLANVDGQHQQSNFLVGELTRNLIHEFASHGKSSRINQNGTLERQTNQAGARCQLMQSSVSSFEPHEYDYIQVAGSQSNANANATSNHQDHIQRRMLSHLFAAHQRQQPAQTQLQLQSTPSSAASSCSSGSDSSGRRKQLAAERQIYSNILLGRSPSHHQLLFPHAEEQSKSTCPLEAPPPPPHELHPHRQQQQQQQHHLQPAHQPSVSARRPRNQHQQHFHSYRAHSPPAPINHDSAALPLPPPQLGLMPAGHAHLHRTLELPGRPGGRTRQDSFGGQQQQLIISAASSSAGHAHAHATPSGSSASSVSYSPSRRLLPASSGGGGGGGAPTKSTPYFHQSTRR